MNRNHRTLNSPERENRETRCRDSGTLFVVGTPIGNLEDITLRALRILKEADLIAAENVRHSKRLCSHHGIETRITSYHQHNRKTKGPEIINRLKAGENVALVTSAGTPAVSDPGSLLVSKANENGIRVSPLPGPSAAIAALSVCGLGVAEFLFLGFLSNRAGKRRNELKKLKDETRTIIFYEAPHRIKSMLKDIKEILGNRKIVVLREMTKVYEEIKHGMIEDIVDELEHADIKGEFTIVLEGGGPDKADDRIDARVRDEIVKMLLENRMGVKDIATRLSREHDLRYRSIYRECIAIKKSRFP
jgi:16S rRNA (cytidine1402-2'-O)-methyltransferase